MNNLVASKVEKQTRQRGIDQNQIAPYPSSCQGLRCIVLSQEVGDTNAHASPQTIVKGESQRA